jgi:hypothetical protein
MHGLTSNEEAVWNAGAFLTSIHSAEKDLVFRTSSKRNNLAIEPLNFTEIERSPQRKKSILLFKGIVGQQTPSKRMLQKHHPSMLLKVHSNVASKTKFKLRSGHMIHKKMREFTERLVKQATLRFARVSDYMASIRIAPGWMDPSKHQPNGCCRSITAVCYWKFTVT